ncbi:MAG: response regulator [Bacteroidales bacterium]|nr:response regulator [Bacteroidales bacterium]
MKFDVNRGEPDDNFAIVTDPLRFRQVVNNLLDNAVKFTSSGTIEVGYTIQDEESLLFYVKDTGIGLPKDKLDLIFERFRQAEESNTREYGGTGLGLTITKKLVELLGGVIWVESEFNVGSTFYFTLPLIHAVAEVSVRDLESLTGKYSWSDKTVLVAEDEMSNFELVKAIFYNTDVNLIHAINGEEAVSILKEKAGKGIDLILMDIRMPVMNGFEATKVIKRINKSVPVIALTAFAMAEDKLKSFEAGCDDYIPKPLKPVEFIKIISKYLV